MKLKIMQLSDCLSVLDGLSNLNLNVKTSYAILKNVKLMNEEINIYEAQRKKLIEKHSKKDKEGKFLIDENDNIIMKNQEDWIKDLSDLLNIEIDLNIHKIDLEDLIDSECKLSPIDLMKIEFILNN